LGLTETQDLAKNAVPNSRRINGKSLVNDVTLNAGDVGAYNKEEANQKFQPLGNYPPAGYSYSKEEANNRYQSKGNYAPTGNYAVRGECYTRGESDGRYQSRGNYQPAGNYQPSGNYAVRGECYTRGESDNRYLKSRGGISLVYTGPELNDGNTASLNQDCRGRFMFFQDVDNHYTTPAIFPEDHLTVAISSGNNGYAHLRLENNGRTLRCVYQSSGAKVNRVWVL
ncbi:hypothetical protein ABLA30_19525, partial [Xenorhabdus nematophila]